MSGKRAELLVNNEFYHIYNRSIANEQIFRKSQFLKHTLELIEYYSYPQRLRYSFFKRMPVEEKKKYLENYRKQEKIIDIHAFVFMDNHFHFLIRQLIEKGIFTFISNFQNSFGKYYNKVNKRNGSVFQKPFKSKRISSDSDFLHVGRYIHLNPVTSFCMDIKELETYPYDSYKCYLEKGVSGFVNTKMTLDLVGSVGKYRKFVEDRVDYQRKLKQIKRLLFE